MPRPRHPRAHRSPLFGSRHFHSISSISHPPLSARVHIPQCRDFQLSRQEVRKRRRITIRTRFFLDTSGCMDDAATSTDRTHRLLPRVPLPWEIPRSQLKIGDRYNFFFSLCGIPLRSIPNARYYRTTDAPRCRSYTRESASLGLRCDYRRLLPLILFSFSFRPISSSASFCPDSPKKIPPRC